MCVPVSASVGAVPLSELENYNVHVNVTQTTGIGMRAVLNISSSA